MAAIPEAGLLNGLTLLSDKPTTLLATDSALGAVWNIDSSSGIYNITIETHAFKPSARSALCITGLRFYWNYLYFTDSTQGSYGRVPIGSRGLTTGEVQILATASSPERAFGEFSMDHEGTGWVTAHSNMLVKVTSGGKGV
jgi:hypothetical protein